MEPQNNLPKSSLAITSIVLGAVSFIPLVGLLLGLMAIVFGIIAKLQIKKGLCSGKALSTIGIILGVLGILVTVAMYGSLFYFGFVAKGGPFEEPKKQLSAQLLTQDAGLVELYKSKTGKYPASLDELSKAGYQVWPSDHYLKAFYYEVSADGSNYDLRSFGPDGEYGTEDDIFPNR